MNFHELCKKINLEELVDVCTKYNIFLSDRDLNYYAICYKDILKLKVEKTDDERIIFLKKHHKDTDMIPDYEALFSGPDENDNSKRTNYALDFQSWEKVASYSVIPGLSKDEECLLVIFVFDDLTFYGLEEKQQKVSKNLLKTIERINENSSLN